jgi:hypothetical protein
VVLSRRQEPFEAWDRSCRLQQAAHFLLQTAAFVPLWNAVVVPLMAAHGSIAVPIARYQQARLLMLSWSADQMPTCERCGLQTSGHSAI